MSRRAIAAWALSAGLLCGWCLGRVVPRWCNTEEVER